MKKSDVDDLRPQRSNDSNRRLLDSTDSRPKGYERKRRRFECK